LLPIPSEAPESALPDAFVPRNVRRIVCIAPKSANSFGNLHHSHALIPGIRAFMPPQGLLVVAAVLPPSWQVRLIDENIARAGEEDLRRADAVFVTGMHVQREEIRTVIRRAHAHGKLVVLGGPSVSAAPEDYPEADIIHVGELGDATTALLERIDASPARPDEQLVLRTVRRLPLERFPPPAYRLIDLRRYLLASIQFSSGCPFTCEFCDIPALYGRRPRLKTARQILGELDAIIAGGARGAVYFVDDNFIADRGAAKELLPHIVEWQRTHGYPLRLSCEATLDLAGCPDLLNLMRHAKFDTVFCGIETPRPEALRAMRKTQNLRCPILDAVETLNRHGLEVVSGIILGLDTDTPETADHVLEFIEESGIPMLTINLLYALPKTPLHDRLRQEGWIIEGAGAASNVRFKLPRRLVVEMWQRCIAGAYVPEKLFARFRRQAETTYRRRLAVSRKVRARDVLLGLKIIGRLLWGVGVRADFRRPFWRTVLPLVRQGRIEEVIHIGLVANHLIRHARDCRAGLADACFYADPGRESHAPAAVEA